MVNITSKYDDYKEIIDYFGAEKIKNRLATFETMYISFLKHNNLMDNIVLHKGSLVNALLDYFTDIYRLKEFHSIELTNRYKILSYEVYWLLKRKPLHIINDLKDEYTFINEKFLLSYTLKFIDSSFPSNFSNTKDIKAKNRFSGFVDTYYYYLKFRNCDPQALELMLLALDAGYTLKSIEKVKD